MGDMPKIWSQTIEAHRDAVREATINATAALVAEHGLTGVTMSQIAKETGIGRATLYKYFPDVESILVAWHQRHLGEHLEHLAQVRDRPGTPGKRLEAVLGAYARITHERRGHPEIAALVHRDEHLAHARHHLHGLVREVIAEAAQAGEVRDDVAPDELAGYCLHALAAAGGLPSGAAVQRLVQVVLSGLLPAQPRRATRDSRR